jgi:hypothetical protein
MVEEVTEFTPSGSELVRSKVITAASMGTNHTALLTSMYAKKIHRCQHTCYMYMRVCIHVTDSSTYTYM